MTATADTPTLADIEKSTKLYSDAHQELRDLVTKLEATIDRYKRKKLAAIRRAVAKAAERKSELHATLQLAPALFKKPRTVVFHGIKVGFQKGKGEVNWEDDEHVSELIKKHFPKQFDTLVKTTRKPVAAALKNLAVDDLQKIGCTVEGTGDVVVIKAVDSEVDKVVAALLKDAVESEAA